jgi:hypothetical protein
MKEGLNKLEFVYVLTIPNLSPQFFRKENGINCNNVRSSTFEHILIKLILLYMPTYKFSSEELSS